MLTNLRKALLMASPLHVVCLGDSITRGQVSADYIKILEGRNAGAPLTFTNVGVNGDLAVNVLERLDSVIDLQPDVVAILIGTNDANASLSEKNIRMMTRVKKLTTRPTLQSYQENLAEIVDRLGAQTSARLALLSLPVLGEALSSESTRRSAEYSAVVKAIAEAHGAAYLPLNERQSAFLQAGGFTPGTAFRDGRALSAGAAIQHFVLRRSFDTISRRRGLQLTTDLIHQNTRGATMIADLIEEFISS
jgi:lysophospholipase L1-like esterase